MPGSVVETSSARPLPGSISRAAWRSPRPVQHPVVIVSASTAQLHSVAVNARTDHGRRPEIEWRVFHRRDDPGGDERGVDRREAVAVYGEDVAENVAGAFAGEIEIGVLRQVDRRRAIRRCFVVDGQGVRCRDTVGDGGRQRSWISFVTVGAGRGETTPAVPFRSKGSARHSFLSKPITPPCRWLGALLVASRYVLPSSVKRPLAIRLA